MFNKVISILGTLILLVLAGCRDVAPISVEEPSTENRTITLNLDITTRADADTEPSHDKFHLWIFSGNKLLKYINSNPTWQESADDGIDLEAKVEAEIDATGITKIEFYLLLNTNVTNPWNITPDQLKTLTFTIHETSYCHDNKVPMSGEQTLEIKSNQYNYTVEIDAERSVAKLGIYCTKGNPSANSTLTINQVTLSKVPEKGYLFKPDDYSSISYSDEVKTLFSGTKEISSNYAGDMPAYSGNSWDETAEKSFDEISSPYLLENPNGVVTEENGFLQVGGTVLDNRYCITLTYTLNGAEYTQKIYVSKIKRNQYSKIYIRINATTINTYCQINSWTEHIMDVPAFE